jgi:hypothetical protein
VKQPEPAKLAWAALTTGGFGGADVLLADAQAGTLAIDTPLVKAQLDVASIGLEDQVLDSGGGITRRMRVFRLPDNNAVQNATFTRRIARGAVGTEDALYICVTLEDGHRIWSSPTYLMR